MWYDVSSLRYRSATELNRTSSNLIERSIWFDSHLFFVSSISFDDRTTSNLIVRLSSKTERSIWYPWDYRCTTFKLLLKVLHLTRTEVFKEFTFQTFLANTLHYKCSSQNLKSCPPYCSQTFSYWCNVSFPFLCLRLHRKLFDFSVRIAKQTKLFFSAWIISSKLFELHPWCIQRLLIPCRVKSLISR